MIKWQCTEVFLHRKPVDFRKSVNGLSAIIEQEMGRDAFSGHVFVFCNKSRDKLKVVYWDKSGFALWYKRLEKERFKWPAQENLDMLTLTGEQWLWLLSGSSVIPHQRLNYTSTGL